MRRLSLSLLICAAALLGCLPGRPAGAAASLGLVHTGTLTIGTNMPYPPMESYDAHHVPVGADIALGRALAARLHLKVAFINVPNFDTIIPTLQRKQYDIIISSMTITPERARLVRFIPYMQAGQSIVVARGNLKHVKTLDDLAGLNASAEVGTTEVATIQAENQRLARLGRPLIALKTYDNDDDALAQLVLGVSDAYLTDYPVAAYHVALSHGTLAISGRQIGVAPYGIAVLPANRPLYAALGAALAALRKDGTYARILASYHVSQGAI